MKTISASLCFMLLSLLIIGCKPASNSSDNQSIIDSVDRKRHHSGKESTHKAPSPKHAEMTGKELIENMSSKLKYKLGLSEQQTNSIHSIFTASFVASGRNLEKKFSSEEYKRIGQEIRKQSKDQVTIILNEQQKTLYEKYFNMNK